MSLEPRFRLVGLLLLAGLILAWPARTFATPIPQVVEKNGRHELLVDGEPFLILGGQCHNSSAWPAALPDVWQAVARMHANTLEAPIYWEQFEPEPGKWDSTLVDTLLMQARERGVRLVLLWFGTWKNGSPHYLPLWMKADPQKYPRLTGRDGKTVDSPSPLAPATLEADKRAFAALLHHLKEVDPQHTVIMVQVENEPGTWGSVRDFSPVAEKRFASPVPRELLAKLGLGDRAGDTWSAVFGPNADEYFHAWHVARFIGEVAAAGKAENPLPLYVNVALRDPLNPGPASSYESGGATDNVLAIWKVAAPAIDLLAPDIYLPSPDRYLKVLELYDRPDNPLFVPETIGSSTVSRFCYAALARGAIGWSPFGIDGARWDEGSARAVHPDPVAAMYQVLGPNVRELATLAADGRLYAAWEDKNVIVRRIPMGRWQAEVTFGPRTLGYGRNPQGNPEPVGRALIGELDENQFVATGYLCRIDFKPTDDSVGARRDFLRVEEGSFEGGEFHAVRIWNGDETDWGLNFGTEPQFLRVRLGTY